MLGIYVHIPFCLQRCHYCDFATYSQDQIQVNSGYVEALLMEIEKRHHLIPKKELNTIYFGGGTPSLLRANELQRILQKIKSVGFIFSNKIEITMEVNPATLDQEKLTAFIDAGINRFSVGSQTFDDELLQACGRKHSSQDTIETLQLIESNKINYSLDLLFALPHQKMQGLQKDLQLIKQINPPHVSAYCLTVPDKHPMSRGREPDEKQVEMFQEIEKQLQEIQLHRYEISNFAKPGYECLHNLIYWQDQDYWGVGLSAHSYIKENPWGFRFWNASDYKQYLKQVEELSPSTSSLMDSFPPRQIEKLKTHQSLTDYCHTALRTSRGLSKDEAHQKYGADLFALVKKRLSSLHQQSLVQENSKHWSLTEKGLLLSNQVFSELLFQDVDIRS